MTFWSKKFFAFQLEDFGRLLKERITLLNILLFKDYKKSRATKEIIKKNFSFNKIFNPNKKKQNVTEAKNIFCNFFIFLFFMIYWLIWSPEFFPGWLLNYQVSERCENSHTTIFLSSCPQIFKNITGVLF